MRFKSDVTGGYCVYAVAGINTVSFAVETELENAAGLLGFAVERFDPATDERYFMYGFKVFESVIPQPDEHTVVSTFDQPVQSFVWDDFTAKPDCLYEYAFHPLKGKPKNLDRTTAPVSIKVRTEPLFTTSEHDVFFNRGVASSQAYAHRFRNRSPDDQPTAAAREQAYRWLARDLDRALLRFVEEAKPGDTLLGCFYEFRWREAAVALKAALARGVDVRLIVDAKNNGFTDKQGKSHAAFPRDENLAMIADVGIPSTVVRLREARKNDIAHNKFIVRLAGPAKVPAEVWTGSTNLSIGGVYGQTNVGHWTRSGATAQVFKAYWDLLDADPGAADADDAATGREKDAAFRKRVEMLRDVPAAIDSISPGITPVLSPRRGHAVLELYADMVDKARELACITLAFGINKAFKDRLKDNTPGDAITFFLLEKEDKPSAGGTQPFVVINASQNVYKAWGSYLREPLYQWTKETNAGALGLNQHVSYIHSKFLLMDPLGDDPIVVTGSANFSDASTNDNDENMLIIRGNARVADIYFTEFNRLFNHYYFRSVVEATRGRAAGGGSPAAGADANLFLRETDAWLEKYQPGKFRFKRVRMLASMKGWVTL